MDINFYSPRYNQYGDIDVMIEHPDFGWIPFTASLNDYEEHGRSIFESLKDVAVPFNP